MYSIGKSKPNMKDKVSILVNSCDKYEDVWKPFFIILKRKYDCPYKIYLNTETKICSEKSVITLNSGVKSISWSLRLKKALKRIKTKYVLFFLEDFFLLEDVNQKIIDEAIKMMDNDKKISVISFENSDKFISCFSNYEGYNLRKEDSMYYLNCQTAIWRRKDLIKFLSPYEDPWQFELFGSERAKLYNKKFLFTSSKGNLPFIYNANYHDGNGLHFGQWLKATIKVFEDNDIKFDFNKRGIYDGQIREIEWIVPKKCFKDRWMYLLYGGGEKVRMGLFEQIKFAVKHPRKNLSVLKRKWIYFFTEKRDV